MNKYVKVDIQSLLISSNKWITNGADNTYFYTVEEAYLGSPTNQSIIDNFTNYILGEGLEDETGSLDISTILRVEFDSNKWARSTANSLSKRLPHNLKSIKVELSTNESKKNLNVHAFNPLLLKSILKIVLLNFIPFES